MNHTDMGQRFQNDRAKSAVTYREPTGEDGPAIFNLIAACPPLDQNSLYANLLQCTHFASTCIVAELDGKICGWISGYRMPDDADTFFVWQVAVGEDARGMGVGKTMLLKLLERPALKGVRYLKTTITLDNEASWSLFKSFATSVDAPADAELYFERERHFAGEHASEHMFAIGPIPGR